MKRNKDIEYYLMICYNYIVIFRGIVQLVERRSPKPNVVGSSPASPAISKSK